MKLVKKEPTVKEIHEEAKKRGSFTNRPSVAGVLVGIKR